MIDNLIQIWDENWRTIITVVFIISFLISFIFGTMVLMSIEFKS
jgi:hypothetical protein